MTDLKEHPHYDLIKQEIRNAYLTNHAFKLIKDSTAFTDKQKRTRLATAAYQGVKDTLSYNQIEALVEDGDIDNIINYVMDMSSNESTADISIISYNEAEEKPSKIEIIDEDKNDLINVVFEIMHTMLLTGELSD